MAGVMRWILYTCFVTLGFMLMPPGPFVLRLGSFFMITFAAMFLAFTEPMTYGDDETDEVNE